MNSDDWLDDNEGLFKHAYVKHARDQLTV